MITDPRKLAWPALLALAGCERPVDDLADGAMHLPPALHEISGMVAIDAHTVACVQDEAGVVFFVDLRGVDEVRAVPFGPDGDFEGIAFTGSDYWVLRSDGLLLRLTEHDGALAIAETHRMPEKCEYEGLCHDAGNRRLLVLPKGAISDKKRERRRRRVFAFDLQQNRPVPEPVLTLKVARVRDHVEGIELRGSEIAVVPGTRELLLLSSADHLLVRVSADGDLLGTRKLDAKRLPQPEAMTFLADGRLIVASEGVRGPATIAVIEGYR